MKIIKQLALMVALSGWFMQSVLAAEVTIDQIVVDNRISGYVRDLSTTDPSGYKVIVYIHTDQWYIHPYAGQGDGQSWASINSDGTWQIATVNRGVPADSIAALVVGRDYIVPTKLESLGIIPQSAKAAEVVRDLRGTPDYGKL